MSRSFPALAGFALAAMTFGVVALLFAAVPSDATAHSGGVNSSGCHAGSQPYHCHRSANETEDNLSAVQQ